MKNTIVLFPGGFKPLHAGHIALISRYAKLSTVNKIKLLVGPKERDGITQQMAIFIAKLFLDRFSNVSVEASKWPSPVLTAFKEVEFASDASSYTLATSNKGKDFERANDFINKHQIGEKYYEKLSSGVSVISLPVSVDPLYYKGRDDNNDNIPISASILRQDVLTDNFRNFKTNYPDEDIYNINKIWHILQQNLNLKKE